MRKRRAACLRVLLALTVLSGCGSSGNSGKPSASPTAAASWKFTALNLGIPDKALKAPVTGRVPEDRTLHVGVTLKVSDAAWKKFGHGKSPAQSAGDVGKQLGVSDETIQKVQAYLGNAHIQAKTSKTRTSVTFDVKAGQAAKLLRTSFVTHRLNGRTYFTPDPSHPPQIPEQLAPYILAVTGLESYSAAPKARGALGASVPGRALPTRAASCIQRFPQKFASSDRVAAAYGYNQMWNQGWRGENMTVNLVEMDGYDRNDVANYVACTGSHIQLGNVNLGASEPAVGAEATLDIQMLAGLAPNLRIVDYQEDPALLNSGNGADSWTALNDALQRISDDNYNVPRPGSVVSISMGGPEGYLSQPIMQAIDQSLRVLTVAERMTVFVSSGDCGAYSDRTYGSLDVSFPATSTYAVAVGGTRLDLAPNGARTQEVVWSDRSNLSRCENQWGSGGGVSKVFSHQQFQTAPGTNNQYAGSGGRQVPDISAAAINLPIYYRGRWVSSGGTSAAAPIWAAGMALVNQGLLTRIHLYCFGPDTFYHVASAAGANKPYTDVVAGNNLYYPATAGFDLSTGLGTPNLPAFFNTLVVNPGGTPGGN
ncbi:S53 family peptidase [Actinoallomurus purpureus]|uniref:S53 family peptidase n=1 Tax=Actinoallomurus purpureus TaxID=478114 RepID=UPI002093DD2B|nr:S53 family peptidase [Actinoallomurus purpureus]MCO6010618.1 S53 family peptidase [Actinoallomurus purpureus]